MRPNLQRLHSDTFAGEFLLQRFSAGALKPDFNYSAHINYPLKKRTRAGKFAFKSVRANDLGAAEGELIARGADQRVKKSREIIFSLPF